MFLSLQRGSCDSPKLCPSSEGLGQDTESPALLLLCEGASLSSAGQRQQQEEPWAVWGLRAPFIQLCCGRGPRAVLAAGKQWRGRL